MFRSMARRAWSPIFMSRGRIATWRISGSARMAYWPCFPCRKGQVSMVWSTAEAHAQGSAGDDRRGAGACGRRCGRKQAWRDAYRRARRRLCVAAPACHATDCAAPCPAWRCRAQRAPACRAGIEPRDCRCGIPCRGYRARGLETDCGATALLRRYERSRKEDILAMEASPMDCIRFSAATLPGLPRLRNAGLNLTNQLRPLKRSAGETSARKSGLNPLPNDNSAVFTADPTMTIRALTVFSLSAILLICRRRLRG